MDKGLNKVPGPLQALTTLSILLLERVMSQLEFTFVYHYLALSLGHSYLVSPLLPGP